MAKFTGPSVIPGAKPELPVQQEQTITDFAQILGPQKTAEPPIKAPGAEPTVGIEQVAQQAQEEIVGPLTPEQTEQRELERVPAFGESKAFEGKSIADYDLSKDSPISAAVNRSVNTANILDASAPGPTLRATLPTAKAEEFKAGKPEAFIYQDSEGNVKEATNPALKDSQTGITASNVILNPKILNASTINEDGSIGIDPEFGRILSLTVEDFLYRQSQQEGIVAQDPDEFLLDEAQQGTGAEITKATQNDQLGRDVYRNWMRQKAFIEGRPTDSYLTEEKNINPNTFTFIGDMAKEIYSEGNPDMLTRLPDQADGQVRFQLSPTAIKALADVNKEANDLYGAREVKPLNAVSETAQPQFEGRTQVRRITTGIDKLGDTRQVDEAMQNYHSVSYVNDPMREKIMLKFGLMGMLRHGTNDPFANMFDIGSERQQEVVSTKEKLNADAERELDPAKKAAKATKAAEYNVNDILTRDKKKFINTLGAISKYSGRPNHLTFSMQALTGRTHIQQTKYNPQAHKATRFVVGGGNIAAWKPGSGILDSNFKEVMASLFLQDPQSVAAKDLTTEERIRLFNKAYKEGKLDSYIAAGQELENTLANFNVEEVRKTLADLLEIPDNEQRAQVRQQLQRDHGRHDVTPGVISLIGKDEHSPYKAEALIELAKYDRAVKNGTQMQSTLNVEMDGKTHGPATNAALLGVREMAMRTGLLRAQDYKVTDLADSRVALGIDMQDHVDSMAGTLFKFDELPAYKQILTSAIKDKPNFLKKSPMTLGYGQELGSLRMHVEATVFTGPQSAEIKDIYTKNNLNPQDVVTFLHTMLVNSLFNVMDQKIDEVPRLLRANNLVSILTNEVLYMENAMGFKSYAAARQTQPIEEEAGYRIAKDGKVERRSAKFYKSEAEGTALRKYRPDEDAVPGGYGHGRVIPIAVQSYDGNMVSKTGSGRSWDTISSRSKARGASSPFVLPIFDAFKTDLLSLDTVRQEANKNWVNGLREHSYITSIMQDWYKEIATKVRQDFSEKDPNEVVQINDDNKWRGINWLFNKYTEDKMPKPNMQKMLKKVLDIRPKKPKETIAEYEKFVGQMASASMKNIYKAMKAEGIPQNFTQLTNKQIQLLINIVVREIQLTKRNNRMVSKIKHDKSKLFDEFARNQREARQVDIA